jgi:hypothetical protein
MKGRPQRHRRTEVERVMGIEPTLAAWEAAVLPLNYTRIFLVNQEFAQSAAIRAQLRSAPRVEV